MPPRREQPQAAMIGPEQVVLTERFEQPTFEADLRRKRIDRDGKPLFPQTAFYRRCCHQRKGDSRFCGSPPEFFWPRSQCH